MCKKLFLFIAVVISIDLSAQDTSYMRYILKQLTSEKFYGRGYSFRGDSIAANFIRDELKYQGVKPLGDNYFQNYTFSTFSMEGPLSLVINGKTLKPYDQYRVPAWSKSTWGSFKVMQVPCETLVNPDKLKRLLKKHNALLSDAFVYVDATQSKTLNDTEREELKKQLQNLRRRNPFNSRGIVVGVDELSTYSPANTEYEHGYAFIEVLRSALPNAFDELKCTIFTQFHPNYKTQNICAYVPGEVDSIIVFTAHYDHLGTMGDSVVFYGAHDNASGVAALMDLAHSAMRVQPYYTHVFCFFSGEEAGLRGSKYMSEHPLFDLKKVRLLVNIDMFCGGDEGLMVFNANDPKVDFFVKRLENLNKTLHIAPEIRRRDNRANSDHYYFSSKVPSLFILTMGQRYGGYHSPYDKCDACGLEHYVNYLTLISSLAM